MGCCGSSEVPTQETADNIDKPYDFHHLSDAQRWEYLSFGSVREFETSNNIIIPIDIKQLLSEYLAGDRIWSLIQLDWIKFGEESVKYLLLASPKLCINMSL